MGTTKRDVEELKVFLKERGLWKKFKKAFKKEEPGITLLDYYNEHEIPKDELLSGAILFYRHKNTKACYIADEEWKGLHG